MKYILTFILYFLIIGKLANCHFLGFRGIEEQPQQQILPASSNPFDKLDYANRETNINLLQISPNIANYGDQAENRKRESGNSMGNGLADDTKCALCNQVYQNKFDYQIMIDQKRCDSLLDSHHQEVDKHKCIDFIRQIARKFFNDGGDDIFEGELYEKVKICRDIEENINNSKNNLYTFNDLKSKGCDRLGGKTCDILLENKFNECSTPFPEKNQQESKPDYAIQNSYENLQRRFSKDMMKNYHFSEKAINAPELSPSDEKKAQTQWEPPHPFYFKNINASVDKQLEEITQLENTVRELEKKLKEAKQTLFNKIQEAQASSKAIQDQLNNVIQRVSSEIRQD